MKKILIVLKLEEDYVKNNKKELFNFLWFKNQEVKYKTLIFCSRVNQKIKEELKTYALGKIVVFKNSKIRNFHSSDFIKIIEESVKKTRTDIVIMEEAIFSKDIVSILAEKLNLEMFTNAIDIEIKKNKLKLKKRVYGENYLKTKEYNNQKIIITFKPSILKKIVRKSQAKKIIIKNLKLENLNIEVLERRKQQKKEKSIIESNIIVAGGKGIKKKEDLKLLNRLSDILGGAVGGSRAIVDLGYIKRSKQIGQSGNSISPNLMFIFGVSGQTQFTAGYTDAKTVISVNKDKEATIFRYSDYCIIGDLYEVIPHIIKSLKNKF